MDDILHITIPVPIDKLGLMYTMLGALLESTAMASTLAPAARGFNAVEDAARIKIDTPTVTETTQANDVLAATDDGTLDSAGWPWNADLHASTKGVTKEGLWRMKVGVSRPDPKPGFPKTNDAPTAADPAATVTATADDDDEFAAFRAAADAGSATDAAAVAAVPPRKWTDADLGLLCNQAAVRLGDPAPVKDLIVAHVPDGTLPHSRNIPDDKREAFAKAVEAKAGITFAG